MAHPELLNSKVLFKPKHWLPIDLEIELVYQLNLKVLQFPPEFCENGVDQEWKKYGHTKRGQTK